MTSALEAFQSSKAWDKRYGLPLVPMHNNPMIYSAYATKIIKVADGVEHPFRPAIYEHIDACQVGGHKGLFHRWPDGSGGVTSHDELMGIAYHSKADAKAIVDYLVAHRGVYDNNTPGSTDLRYSLFRFPWLMPYLRSRAGTEIGKEDQYLFAAHLFVDALRYQSGDEGGRLRIWLMLGEMNNYDITDTAIDRWKSAMVKKGMSPKKCFEKYLKEVPEFRKYAPNEF